MGHPAAAGVHRQHAPAVLANQLLLAHCWGPALLGLPRVRPARLHQGSRAAAGTVAMLKQPLTWHRIGAPGSDFAATYLHKLGFDAGRRLPELFRPASLGIVLDLADALLPVQLMPVGQRLFGALSRRWPVITAAREPGAALRGTTGESAHCLGAPLRKGHQ